MSDLDVLINPPEILASALQPALGIALETPIGREIIQGMDYESGEWKQNGQATSKTISFTKQHKKAPCLFLVYAAPGTIGTNILYGELFVDYLQLHGSALQTTLSQAKYGVRILWYPVAASTIGQNITSFTNSTDMTSIATNTSFLFAPVSSGMYLATNRKYSWIAIWMPE